MCSSRAYRMSFNSELQIQYFSSKHAYGHEAKDFNAHLILSVACTHLLQLHQHSAEESKLSTLRLTVAAFLFLAPHQPLKAAVVLFGIWTNLLCFFCLWSCEVIRLYFVYVCVRERAICAWLSVYKYIYMRIFKVLLCICFIPWVCVGVCVCVLGLSRTPCYLCMWPSSLMCGGVGLCTKLLSRLSNEKDEKSRKGKAGRDVWPLCVLGWSSVLTAASL